MKQVFAISVLTLTLSVLTSGQATRPASPKSNSDRCEVTVGDPKTKRSDDLGSFTTVIGEEELTTKAFPLPRSSYFIVASVFYTDESLASKDGSDSISMELALSRNKQRNVLSSLSWAEAEVPLSTFEVGRVVMLIKVDGRSRLVLMQCKSDVRL